MRTPFLDSGTGFSANDDRNGTRAPSFEWVARFRGQLSTEPVVGGAAAPPEAVLELPDSSSVGSSGLECLPAPRQHDLQFDQLSGDRQRTRAQESTERDGLSVDQPTWCRADRGCGRYEELHLS